MHEYSILSSLLEQVEAAAAAHGASRVHGLTVRIGEASGVDARLLAIAFETFRAQTVCAQAALTIEPVKARWQCPHCGKPPAANGPLRCFECNQPAQLVAGDEIVLAHLDLEVPDHVH